MMHKRVRAIMLHTFVPCVRVTSVLPMVRSEKLEGALTSYQSFFEKGSTLLHATKVVSVVARERRRGSVPAAVMHGLLRAAAAAYTFFLPPFLPFEMRLFLPTAMLGNRLRSAGARTSRGRSRATVELGRRLGFCADLPNFLLAAERAYGALQRRHTMPSPPSVHTLDSEQLCQLGRRWTEVYAEHGVAQQCDAMQGQQRRRDGATSAAQRLLRCAALLRVCGVKPRCAEYVC